MSPAGWLTVEGPALRKSHVFIRTRGQGNLGSCTTMEAPFSRREMVGVGEGARKEPSACSSTKLTQIS